MSRGTAVVTIVHGRRAHLRGQAASLRRCRPLPDAWVVVGMDDDLADWQPPAELRTQVEHVSRVDGRLPLAAARNLGARVAAQEADVLVLLDVDCLADPHLVGAYREAVVGCGEALWSGPVTYLDPPPPTGYDLTTLELLDSPHPARPVPARGERTTGGDPDLFWSLSFATSDTAWRRLGGFDEGYLGYGGEDTDLAHRAVAAGLTLGWTGSARAFHQHHPVSDPPVEHLDDILVNGRRFADRWGRWPMQGWLDAFEAQDLVRRVGDGWERTPR